MPRHQTIADMKIIGQNLKHLRQEHGLTQKDIAGKLGVSFQQIQKYETGQNKLPIENLFFLKQFYNIPFDTFFGGINLSAKHGAELSEDSVQKLLSRIGKMQDEAKKKKILRVIRILAA